MKGSFFKVRRFHDREDLERQLAAWLEEVNRQRPSRATNEIPAARMRAERERLSPLPMPAADYALRFAVTVRTTGFVEHEGIRDSLPPETIGIPGTLFLYPDRVRIVTRSGTAVEHPRHPAVGNTSVRTEDRVAKLAAVHGQRARLYQKRQEILDLGPPAEVLLSDSAESAPNGSTTPRRTGRSKSRCSTNCSCGTDRSQRSGRSSACWPTVRITPRQSHGC